MASPSVFSSLKAGLLHAVSRAGRLFESCLRRCQPGRQQTERGAGDVVQANLVAELDGLRIAAVLAANAHLEVVPG